MFLKNVEKQENNTAVFTVASDAAEFEKAVQSAYLKNRKDVYMASFTIDVTNKYGVDTFQDVKNTYDWIVTSVNELNVDVIKELLKVKGIKSVNYVIESGETVG